MHPLLVLFSIGLLTAGCFTKPEPTAVEETAPATPAQRALADLTAMQAHVNAMPMPERTTLRGHGALLARSDSTARAAVGLTIALRSSLAAAPAMQINGTFAATAPRLAARVDALHSALDAHSALLHSLTILPLPGPDPRLEDDALVPEVVEAAVEMETATSGQWPMKRVYTAYAYELEAIASEARQLAACEQTCPDGVALRASALADEADHLAGLLAEFAALYC